LYKKIGYIGRWWDYDECTISCNFATDEYVENHPGNCIGGYVLFDSFTTDENGDIIKSFNIPILKKMDLKLMT